MCEARTMKNKKKKAIGPAVESTPIESILDKTTFKTDRLLPDMENDTNQLVIVGKKKKPEPIKDEKASRRTAPEKKKLSKKERKRLEKVIERKDKSQKVGFFFVYFIWSQNS